jgi:hypothetical protein
MRTTAGRSGCSAGSCSNFLTRSNKTRFIDRGSDAKTGFDSTRQGDEPVAFRLYEHRAGLSTILASLAGAWWPCRGRERCGRVGAYGHVRALETAEPGTGERAGLASRKKQRAEDGWGRSRQLQQCAGGGRQSIVRLLLKADERCLGWGIGGRLFGGRPFASAWSRRLGWAMPFRSSAHTTTIDNCAPKMAVQLAANIPLVLNNRQHLGDPILSVYSCGSLWRLLAARIPAIIFSRIAGSAHRALVRALIFSRAIGSAQRALDVAALILSRWVGSAHRALARALSFSRSTGSAHRTLVRALIFSRAIGSAHRAVDVALILSRSIGSSHRALTRALCLSRCRGSAHRRLAAALFFSVTPPPPCRHIHVPAWGYCP